MTRVYRRLRPTQKQMQAECDDFNAKHPIGTLIWVFPGDVRGRLAEVNVVEPGAYILYGHTAVVQVSGRHGCIALTHVYDAPSAVITFDLREERS